jgi:hypothetical protein
MKRATIISVILIVICIVLVFTIGLFITEKNIENTYIQCCEGNPCTDIYYTSEDNLCHLVLCENSMFTNKEDCVYEGANIPLNMSG